MHGPMPQRTTGRVPSRTGRGGERNTSTVVMDDDAVRGSLRAVQTRLLLLLMPQFESNQLVELCAWLSREVLSSSPLFQSNSQSGRREDRRTAPKEEWVRGRLQQRRGE
jgi:hypothetical protein